MCFNLSKTIIPLASEDLIVEKHREVKNRVAVSIVTHQYRELRAIRKDTKKAG